MKAFAFALLGPLLKVLSEGNDRLGDREQKTSAERTWLPKTSSPEAHPATFLRPGVLPLTQMPSGCPCKKRWHPFFGLVEVKWGALTQKRKEGRHWASREILTYSYARDEGTGPWVRCGESDHFSFGGAPAPY